MQPERAAIPGFLACTGHLRVAEARGWVVPMDGMRRISRFHDGAEEVWLLGAWP